MKDSQPRSGRACDRTKYIKANNERFSTRVAAAVDSE